MPANNIKFLPFPNGIPSHDTFNRVFSRIDPDAFVSWIKLLRPVLGQEVVAVDGKTVRRSHDKSKSKVAIHMVSAWATESALVLGQTKTSEKSNEIVAIHELLEPLALEGCLVSIDAVGCQKNIVKKIVSKNADYLLAVKDNQPTLKVAIQETLDHWHSKPYSNTAIDYYESEGNSRNRYEIRLCWVTQSLGKLDRVAGWEG